MTSRDERGVWAVPGAAPDRRNAESDGWLCCVVVGPGSRTSVLGGPECPAQSVDAQRSLTVHHARWMGSNQNGRAAKLGDQETPV